MNTRKVVLISLLSNLTLFSLLVGAFTLTAQANGSPSPATAPAVVGPFYYTLSAMDFNAYDDVTMSFSRSGLALYRTSASDPSIAVAPVHLPSGANVRELYLDAFDDNGSSGMTVRLQACPLTTSGCSTAPAGAAITTNNSGRQQLTAAFDFTVNNQSEALFIEADYTGGQTPNVSLYFVRLAYYLPSPVFLPAVQR